MDNGNKNAAPTDTARENVHNHILESEMQHPLMSLSMN